jgi:hypothetical protein
MQSQIEAIKMTQWGIDNVAIIEDWEEKLKNNPAEVAYEIGQVLDTQGEEMLTELETKMEKL